MNTHRMNITLPKDLAAALSHKTNKSAFIAEALREKLAAQERAALEEKLAKAYREAAQEDKSLISEWDAVSGDAL